MKAQTESGTKLAPTEGRKGHLIGLIASRLGGHFIEKAQAGLFEDQIVIPRLFLTEVLAFLQQDPDANLRLLVDISALENQQGALEIVYRLRSPRLGYRLRASLLLPPDDLVVPSIVRLYRGADWLERELWEMFGIYPDGHPHLRPLLLYPGFSAAPLRKSFSQGQELPLVGPRALSTAAKQSSALDEDNAPHTGS